MTKQPKTQRGIERRQALKQREEAFPGACLGDYDLNVTLESGIPWSIQVGVSSNMLNDKHGDFHRIIRLEREDLAEFIRALVLRYNEMVSVQNSIVLATPEMSVALGFAASAPADAISPLFRR